MANSISCGILHYKTPEGERVRLLYHCPGCQREGSYVGVMNGNDLEAVFNSRRKIIRHHTNTDLGELKVLENGVVLTTYSFYGRFTEEDKLNFLQKLRKCVEDRVPAVVFDSRLSSVLETLFPSRLDSDPGAAD